MEDIIIELFELTTLLLFFNEKIFMKLIFFPFSFLSSSFLPPSLPSFFPSFLLIEVQLITGLYQLQVFNSQKIFERFLYISKMITVMFHYHLSPKHTILFSQNVHYITYLFYNVGSLYLLISLINFSNHLNPLPSCPLIRFLYLSLFLFCLFICFGFQVHL